MEEPQGSGDSFLGNHETIVESQKRVLGQDWGFPFLQYSTAYKCFGRRHGVFWTKDDGILLVLCHLCNKCYSNFQPFKEGIQDPKLLLVFAFTSVLKLDKYSSKKDKTIIFKQGWRILHMYLLHFQSHTLTPLIGAWIGVWRCLQPLPILISPKTHTSPCEHGPVTKRSPARFLIPLAFCALLSETGSCRQSTEHPWPASFRLTHCHINSLLKFVTR